MGLLFILQVIQEMDPWWNDDRGKPKNSVKSPVQVPLCPAQILGLNRGIHGERLDIKCLNHGMSKFPLSVNAVCFFSSLTFLLASSKDCIYEKERPHNYYN
jgi:hypothetical protein